MTPTEYIQEYDYSNEPAVASYLNEVGNFKIAGGLIAYREVENVVA